MLNRTLPIIALCGCLVLAQPAPVFAQAPTEIPALDDLDEEQQRELASLIDLAEVTSKRGEFDKAITYFEEAYALFPHPQLLYRMAELHERKENYAEAADLYQRFADAMPDASEAPSARRKALEMREKSSALQARESADATSMRILTTPPGAQVFFAEQGLERLMGSSPTVDLPVRPGKYTVVLKLPGYRDKTVEIEVTAGQQLSREFDLEPLPDTSTDDAGGSGAAPWIMLGVGVAGTASAITFGLLFNDINRGPDKNLYTQDEFRKRQSYETATYVSGGVAIIGFAGALIFWLARDSSEASLELPGASRATVRGISPWWTRGGGGLGVELSF